MVVLPVLIEKLVLIVAVAEIDQDDLGVAGNGPVPKAALHAVGLQGLADGLHGGAKVFLKLRVVAQIRPQKPIVLAKVVHSLQGLAADNSVNAANLVADFPGSLEKCDIAVIHVCSRLLSIGFVLDFVLGVFVLRFQMM